MFFKTKIHELMKNTFLQYMKKKNNFAEKFKNLSM